ncbi:MAG TPA: hypothetical protein VNM48_08460 [Chloroflexota bacterium]|nr:hypothetical protein [Chloroflexota bacterium]
MTGTALDSRINGFAAPPEPPPLPSWAPVQDALGSAAPVPPSQGPGQGPRIPKRETWVALPEEYPGFRIKLWINAPKRVVDTLSQGEEGARAMLKSCVTEHNGWLDEDGAPLPQPTQDGFWDTIPTELATLIITLYQEAVFALPNSILSRKNR